MTKHKTPMTISRAAKEIGIGIETIRYYQRIGLIAEPSRPMSGYRIYPPETLERLRFILRAKDLGFSLAEIESLLELGDGSCRESMLVAKTKLQLIQTKIADLQNLEQVLEGLVNACESNPDTHGCPLVETLISQPR